LACGLVGRVVPPAELDGAVSTLAGEIAAAAPLAVRAVKRALALAGDLPLAEALAVIERLRRPLDDTADYSEGLAAFAEGHPPRGRLRPGAECNATGRI